MRPRETHYYLCTTSTEYQRCHALLRTTATPAQRLSFPTVYAERDGQVLGCLSTSTAHQSVCAGPLVLAPTLRQTIFVALRLVEAYDRMLYRAGVRQYLFAIAKDRGAWRAIVERIGLKSYGEDAQSWWYRRSL